jgi:hypothetical protein
MLHIQALLGAIELLIETVATYREFFGKLRDIGVIRTVMGYLGYPDVGGGI